METHQQMLDKAVGAPPDMASEDRFAVRGNTRTIAAWHLERTPLEREAEAERQAALEAEEVARIKAGLEERYQVMNEERKASGKAWRDWLASRAEEGAPPLPDFISEWRSFVPAAKPQQNEIETVGEARFCKVVGAQHDKCILCEAMATARADYALSRSEMMQRLRRLEHSVPKLLNPLATGGPTTPGARDESTFDDLVSDSAWDNELASPGQDTAISNEGMSGSMLAKVGSIESTLDIKEGQYTLSQTITKFLVKSAPGDTEIMDRLINNEAFRQQSEAVRQRVNLYRANREAARSALIAANGDKRLSVDDIENASKAKADALELERDLAMLETSQRANKARIEQVKKGYSVLEHNKKFCEMRRYKWTAGIDREEEELEDRQEVRVSSTKANPFEKIKMMRREYQEQRNLRATPPPACEETLVSNGSPPLTTLSESPESQTKGPPVPAALNESLEPQIQGPGPFAKTLQEFNRQTREQDDNASVSTDGDPFGLEEAARMPSTSQKTAEPSTEAATNSTLKGKEKKDSKVEGLLQEDGISLRDFAPEPEQNRRKPFRKLSAGCPS